MKIFTIERRAHGFIKVYEPPGHREEDENEDETVEYDFRHVAKETHIPNQTVNILFNILILYYVYCLSIFPLDVYDWNNILKSI